MDFVQQLKASVDIVRVIQDYVRLRKVGTRFTGLCPFHNEKSPSFSVNPALQFYYCHGCHAGGDVLTFVMNIEHLSFFEARNTLAERNGIPLPKRSEYSDDDSKLRAAIYRMHELAEEEFIVQLAGQAGAEARAYLVKRGVSAESVEHFRIGFAGRSLGKFLEAKGFPKTQVEASGLVGRREDGSTYDLFRNRLMFPIHNEQGKTIGFGGRALDPNEKAKYINSPETPIYKKKMVLFNLHRAREVARTTGRLVLVEGYMDAIGVYASGMRDVVATCGTALTREQVQVMKRHAPQVTVNFDPDKAGSNAAEKSIQTLLAESMKIHVVQLDGGLDPDEYCRQHGGEAYSARVEKAKSYFYWLADRARARFDMKTAEGRVEAFQFLLPAVQGLTDKIERSAVANDVAAYLNVNSGLVLENFRKLAADKRDQTVQVEPDRLCESDRILISIVLMDPEAREQILPQVKEIAAIRQSAACRIFDALFALEAAGEQIQFATLHDRLEEGDRKLLSATLLGHHANQSSVTLEAALSCLETLRATDVEAARTQLKARIKDAERAGNFAEALALMQKL